MENKRNIIDFLFSEATRDFKVAPPSNTFSKIISAYEYKKSKNRRIIIYWAAACFLMMITFAAGFFTRGYFTNRTELTEIKSEKLKNSGEISIPQQEETLLTQKTFFQNGNDEIQNIEETSSQRPVVKKIFSSDKNNLKQNPVVPENQNILPSNIVNSYTEKPNIINIEKPLDTIQKKSKQVFPNLHSPTNLNEPVLVHIEKEIQKNKSRYFIGGEFALNISRMTSFSDATSLNKFASTSTEKTSNEIDMSRSSYTAGITTGYELSQRFTLVSGLTYSRLNLSSSDFVFESNATQLYAARTNTGKLEITNKQVLYEIQSYAQVYSGEYVVSNTQLLQQFAYVEIPLIIKYKLIDNILDVTLLTGLEASYLVKNAAFLIVDSESREIGKTSDMNSMVGKTVLGLGTSFPIIPNFELLVEPTIKISLNSISNDPNYRLRPYSFGIYTGLIFNFK